jgi:outer membrane protein TolC
MKWFFASILCFFLSTGIIMRSPSAFGFSLQDARVEALKAYWGVKIAHEQYIAAESERKVRFADLFPKLNVDGNLTSYNKPSEFLLSQGALSGPSFTFPTQDTLIEITNRTTYQVGPSLEQPVFVGGRLYYGFRQSQAVEEQANWNEKQAVNDILFDVEKAYVGVLESEAEKKVAEKDLDYFRKLHSDVEKKFKAGRSTLDDVLKVMLKEARSEQILLTATSDLKIKDGQFNLLIVRPVDAPVTLDPVPDLQPVTFDLIAALSLAQSHRPDLQEAVAAFNAAGFSRRVAEADYYPQVNTGAKWYRQDVSPSQVDQQRWLIYLTADWNLWEWGGTNQRVEQAQAQIRQADYQVKQLSDQIQLDVHQAWLKLDESEKQIQVAASAVEHAKEDLRVIEVGYQGGVKTITDLIESEAVLSQAELNDLRAHFTAQIARATLRYSIGIMDEESLVRAGGSN